MTFAYDGSWRALEKVTALTALGIIYAGDTTDEAFRALTIDQRLLWRKMGRVVVDKAGSRGTVFASIVLMERQVYRPSPTPLGGLQLVSDGTDITVTASVRDITNTEVMRVEVTCGSTREIVSHVESGTLDPDQVYRVLLWYEGGTHYASRLQEVYP